MRLAGSLFPLPAGGWRARGHRTVHSRQRDGPSRAVWACSPATPLRGSGSLHWGLHSRRHPEGRASAPIRVFDFPGCTPLQGVGVPPSTAISRPAAPLLRGSDSLLRPRRVNPGRTGRLWRPAPAAPHAMKCMPGSPLRGRAPGYTLRGRGPLGVAAPRRFAYSITVPDLSFTAPRFDLRHRGGRCAGRPVPRRQHGNITRSSALDNAPTSALMTAPATPAQYRRQHRRRHLRQHRRHHRQQHRRSSTGGTPAAYMPQHRQQRRRRPGLQHRRQFGSSRAAPAAAPTPAPSAAPAAVPTAAPAAAAPTAHRWRHRPQHRQQRRKRLDPQHLRQPRQLPRSTGGSTVAGPPLTAPAASPASAPAEQHRN